MPRPDSAAPVPAPPPVPGRAAWKRAELLLPALAVAVFGVSVGFDFTSWDDGALITTNPHLRTVEGLRRIWTSDENEQYYPLTFTTHWLEYHVFGLAPAGYHAINVALHALNTVILLRLLAALGLGRAGALLAATLFAIHPVQVMSVAWVSERKNLLSTTFALVTMLLWLRSTHSGRARVAAFGAYALALLSKTSVLLLPVVLAVLDVAVLRMPARRALVRVAPMFALAAASALLTMHFERKFVGTPIPPVSRPLIAAAALGFYLWKLVLPLELLPIYPRWNVVPSNPAWWIPVAVLLVAAIAGVRWRRRLPGLVILSAALFVLILLPALGLVMYGNLELTFVSDHYLYLPCVGAFVVAGLAFERLVRTPPGRPWIPVAAAGILVALACRTLVALPAWRDATSLWTATVDGNPDCYAAHFGLAQAAEQRGDFARASAEYRAALAVRPGEMDTWMRLGGVQRRLGDTTAAEASYRAALRLGPSAPARFALGNALEAQRRFDEAEAAYLEGLAADPRDAAGQLSLAGLYLGLARREEALARFRRASELTPDEPWPAIGIATCLRGLGRRAEAVDLLRSWRARRPDDVAVLNHLARFLATRSGAENPVPEEALPIAARAAEITRRNDPHVLDTLGAALAAAGRFPEAAAVADEAADRAAEQGLSGFADQCRRHGDEYRERRVLDETPIPPARNPANPR